VRRLAIVVALVLAPSAQAADHLMHVNEVSVSPGDVTKQFVEFLDPGEPFPQSTYSLAILDSGGAIVQEQTFTQPHGFALRTDPYVVGKAGVSGRDELLTLTIPNAPGKACFYRGSPAASASVIHCLQYGVTPAGSSAQLQSCESVAFAPPTPGAQNTAVAGACAGGGGGGGTAGDKRKPKTTLGGKKTQDIDKLAVTVTLDEDGRVSATATVRVPNSAKVYRFKRATKSARSGRKVKLRLKLSTKAKRAAKRALRSGRKLKAKVKVTAADKAKNRATKTRSIRLKS
jgi:hypothetical protein